MRAIILIPPIVGAIIGYITNVIAVELLFHPKKPVKLLGFKIQGLVPARSREITERFLETLSDFLTKEDFEFVIGNAVNRTLSESYAAKLNELFNRYSLSSFGEAADKLGFGKIVTYLSDAISKLLYDSVKETVVRSIADNIDLKEFVIKKAEEISEDEIEKIFKKFAKRELRFIEISGAILGFIIGVLQSILMYFIILH